MKITAIRATPVNIPLEAPYLWSYGALGGFSKCIVEVETSDGLTGLGEAPSYAHAALIDRLFVEQGPYDKFRAPDRPGVRERLPLR